MKEQKIEAARKQYVRSVNQIKRNGINALRSEVASNLTDSMELLQSIKAVVKRDNKVPYLVQWRFAKQGIFQQLGVSGQFGNIGVSGKNGTITSSTGMKKTHWFDNIYDVQRAALADAAATYHADVLAANVEFPKEMTA